MLCVDDGPYVELPFEPAQAKESPRHRAAVIARAQSRVRSGGPKPGRLIQSLESIVARPAFPEFRSRAFVDGLGQEYFVGGGRRLRARGNVHYRADRGQIVMGAPELSEIYLSGGDSDTDPDLPPSAPTASASISRRAIQRR